MGAEPAHNPGSPLAREREGYDRRPTRFSTVGEVVRLYRNLEVALGQAADTELVRLAAQAREGAVALEEWARRVEAFRGFKRRFEAGVDPGAIADRRGRRPAAPVEAARYGRSPLRFVWEALAFAVGFVVSILLA
jgi:hypothetical protein